MAKNYTTSASGSGNWNSSYVRREDARIIYLKRAIEILAQINEFFEETNMKLIRVTYYELIDISATTTGSLQQTPVGATINEVALGTDTGALLSTLTAANTPTFESPLTPDGDFIGVDLDVDGNYITSDTFIEPVALIYTFVITFKDFKDYVSENFTIDHTATDLPTKIVAHPDEPDQFSPGQNTNNLEEIIDNIGGYREATHTGRLKGGEVTQENLTQVRIQAGLGVIVDSFTDPENPVNTFVEWDEQVVSLDPPAGEFTGVIAFNSLGQIVRVFGAVTAPQLKTLVPVVRITINPFTGDILEFNSLGSLSNNFLETIFDWMNVRGFNQIIDGLLVEQSVLGGPMQLLVTEGNVFSLGINLDVDRANPNRKLFNELDPADLLYVDSFPNVYNTLNLVDPNNYDPGFGGVRTPVPAGLWTNQLVYVTIGRRLFVQYGDDTYSTDDDALQNLPLEDLTFQTPEEIGGIVIRRLWITIQQGTTDLDNATLTPIVGQTPAGGGGDAGVSDKIVDGDQDTRVETEFTGDDDTVRIFTDGNESARFSPGNTGIIRLGADLKLKFRGDNTDQSISSDDTSGRLYIESKSDVFINYDSDNNNTTRKFIIGYNARATQAATWDESGIMRQLVGRMQANRGLVVGNINDRNAYNNFTNNTVRIVDTDSNANTNAFEAKIDAYGQNGNRAWYLGTQSSSTRNIILLNDQSGAILLQAADTNKQNVWVVAGFTLRPGATSGGGNQDLRGYSVWLRTSQSTVTRMQPHATNDSGAADSLRNLNAAGGNITFGNATGNSGSTRPFTRTRTVGNLDGVEHVYNVNRQQWHPMAPFSWLSILYLASELLLSI